MKINSNTVSIEKTSAEYKALEEVITKIASENKIENVAEVQIALSQNSGLIGFKTADLTTPVVSVANQPSQESIATETEAPISTEQAPAITPVMPIM